MKPYIPAVMELVKYINGNEWDIDKSADLWSKAYADYIEYIFKHLEDDDPIPEDTELFRYLSIIVETVMDITN